MDDSVKVNEESAVTIPLKNLISILTATAVCVVGYYQISNRITALENQVAVNLEEIEENDEWIDNFEPPSEVKDSVERVRELEGRVLILETLFERELTK
jgi:agmatine/peptidylarginine deiminase